MRERTTAAEYQENDVDALAVGQFAEDVRDAVIEYQVSLISLVIVRVNY